MWLLDSGKGSEWPGFDSCPSLEQSPWPFWMSTCVQPDVRSTPNHNVGINEEAFSRKQEILGRTYWAGKQNPTGEQVSDWKDACLLGIRQSWQL